MLSFFVFGRPQPEAKKQAGIMKSGRKYNYKRDKDDSKRAWMENVRLCARRAMYNQGKIGMIPAGVGIVVNYQFFFRRAKSNKDEQMVIKPDESRLIEAIDDALEGVCYKNDMQITRHSVRKDYIFGGQDEGVFIQVQNLGR